MVKEGKMSSERLIPNRSFQHLICPFTHCGGHSISIRRNYCQIPLEVIEHAQVGFLTKGVGRREKE